MGLLEIKYSDNSGINDTMTMIAPSVAFEASLKAALGYAPYTADDCSTCPDVGDCLNDAVEDLDDAYSLIEHLILELTNRDTGLLLAEEEISALANDLRVVEETAGKLEDRIEDIRNLSSARY